MKIDFELPKDKKYHQFCQRCHSESVRRIFKKEKTYYRCPACKTVSERMIVIDPDIKWWIDKKTNEYWHESVGAFLINEKKETLLFKRTIYPFAYTLPAGHIDTGDRPLAAVKKELLEETGLKVKKLKLFSKENVIGDKCRRGADNHHWHLYIAHISSNFKIKINDEGIQPIWLTLDEALSKKLVYPVRYFIKKYGNNLLK